LPEGNSKRFGQIFFDSIDNRTEHFLKLLTSGFYFAVTFILLHYLGHAWSTSNAHNQGYAPFFSYAGIDSLLGTTGWTAKKIGIIYLMPPLVGLIAFTLGILGISFAKTKQLSFKTFMFWLSLNGLLMYVSYITTGLLSGLSFSSKYFTGFVGFYSWLFWKELTIYGVLILQLILCVPIIYYFGKLTMTLNYSSALLKRKNGKIIVWLNILVIPFLIGVFIIAAATFPMDLGFQAVRIFTFIPISLLIVVAMHLQEAKHIAIVKGGMKGMSMTLWTVVIIILIFISRTFLSMSIGPLW